MDENVKKKKNRMNNWDVIPDTVVQSDELTKKGTGDKEKELNIVSQTKYLSLLIYLHEWVINKYLFSWHTHHHLCFFYRRFDYNCCYRRNCGEK